MVKWWVVGRDITLSSDYIGYFLFGRDKNMYRKKNILYIKNMAKSFRVRAIL